MGMLEEYMRRVLICGVVIASVSFPVVASQSRGGSATAGGRVSACALLPVDLMVKVGGINPAMAKYLEPEEEAIGATGSACEYGDVRLQVNPFGKGAQRRDAPGKEWQAVADLGESAFFRRNGSQYAELMVWAGANHITIQFGVPTGSTPESIRPNTIALANAILPKLR